MMRDEEETPVISEETLDALRARMKSDPGAEPVTEVEKTLRRFLWFPADHHFTMATLWVVYTHLLARVDGLTIAPRLGIFSGSPGSGKTVALDLLSRLAANGQPVGSLSPAAMLRVISLASKSDTDTVYPVTLFPDELDQVYAVGQSHEELTMLLNQGYKRGAVILRADVNDQTKLVEYDCFAPVAFAGLATAKIPDALLSRTLMIHTKRARVDEQPDKYFNAVHDDEVAGVREVVASWADEKAVELSDPRVLIDILMDERVTGVTSGRDHELWSALFVVAVLAGGNWPRRCLLALESFKDDVADRGSESRSMRLLTALREHYETAPRASLRKSIAYSDIADIALTLDSPTFARFHSGPDPEFSAPDVKPLLSEHGLKSRQVRTASGSKSRGYAWDDLRDAWGRVLPDFHAESEEGERVGDTRDGDVFGQPR